MKQKIIPTIIKGFVIGSSMLVPGVSGGTMAIMLNIYSELIGAINKIRTDFKKSFKFLLIFCIGSITGMILLSKPLSYLINCYEMPMMYFFIGAVAGSIPLIYHQAGVRKFSLKTIIFPAIGLILILLLGLLPENLFAANSQNKSIEIIGLLIAGIIAAIALILPGISVSHMLLMLGLYESTINAIGSLNILYLLPLATGLLLGIFITTKLLDKLMSRHPQATFLIIMGFIIGSVLKVFPGIPVGIELFICLILFAVGFFTMYKISMLDK